MSIVLSASSVKCTYQSKIFRKKRFVYLLLMASNLFIGITSTILYGVLEFVALKESSGMIDNTLVIMFLVLYVLCFILGLLIQIGDGIS